MLTDQLWGGTLERLSIDARTQDVSLEISVTSGGTKTSFDVLLRGASQFHFTNDVDDGPWEYAEVTEFRASKDEASGRWAFDIVLWSEDSAMSGRCASIHLNGAALT
jgi:hypothetical protein